MAYSVYVSVEKLDQKAYHALYVNALAIERVRYLHGKFNSGPTMSCYSKVNYLTTLANV